jgi:hypothetical protein
LIFIFGGNSHTHGSLTQIEKYQIDFDKWTILDISLKRPIHDMQVMQIPDSDKILVFGGHTDQGGPNKEIEIIDLGDRMLEGEIWQ